MTKNGSNQEPHFVNMELLAYWSILYDKMCKYNLCAILYKYV